MWDPPKGLGGLELNARVGLMFSKRIRRRILIKGRFWRGGSIYIYIFVCMCTYTYMHAYIYMYIYIHTCIYVRNIIYMWANFGVVTELGCSCL